MPVISNINEFNAVVTDLFGVPTTAHAWARYAQNNWGDYLAAADNPAGHIHYPRPDNRTSGNSRG